MAYSDSTSPAAPWALLWLTGFAGVSWLALILSDRVAESPPPATGAFGADAAPQPAGQGGDRSSSSSHARPAALPVPLAPEMLGAGQPASPLSLASASPTPSFVVTPPQWNTTPAPLQQRFDAVPAAQPPRLPSQARRAAPSRPGGAVLLGGPLDLASLQEKEMVPAARIEQAQRLLSPDRLQALPLHWRRDMEALLRQRQQEQLMPAEVVRLPAPHLSSPEEIPLAVRSDGADTTVEPSSPRSKQALERWMNRQATPSAGQVRPVVVVLEPINATSAPVASASLPVAAAAATSAPAPVASAEPVAAEQAAVPDAASLPAP